MKINLLKILLLLFWLNLSFFVYLFYLSKEKSVKANVDFPCNKTTDREWHSLRPYRKSPCNTTASDLALFCGNDFVLMDSFSFTRTFNFGDTITWNHQYQESSGSAREINPFPPEDPPVACGYCDHDRKCIRKQPPCDESLGCDTNNDCAIPTPQCIRNENGTERCFFNVKRSKKIKIDLSGSYLPIMGLTEEPYVVNLNIQTDTVDDRQKVNEYVSWYLNGVFGRAEYSPPKSDPKEEGYKSIPDFSGPLKKLISWDNQFEIRVKEIDKALSDIRHNQITTCWINQCTIPIVCWFFQGFNIRYPKDCKSSNNKRRIEDWQNEKPPLRKDYVNFQDFWNVFQEWRWTWGIQGEIFGIKIKIRTGENKPFQLFPYIPFFSTEDRVGKVEISTYSVQPPITSQSKILFSELTNQKPADLFFAHMQETKELSEILQNIFVSKTLIEKGITDKPADPQIVPYQPFCDILEIRTNPGDKLFPGEIEATLNYITQTSCDFYYPYPSPGAPEGNVCKNVVDSGATCQYVPDNYDCEKYYGKIDCGSNNSCSKNCKRFPEGACSSAFTKHLCYPNDWVNCQDVQSKVFNCKVGVCNGNIKCEYGSTCNGEPCSAGQTCTGEYCPPKKNCYLDLCPSGYTCASSCERPIDTPNNVQSCPVQAPVAFKTQTSTPLVDQIWSRLVAGPAGVFKRIFPQIRNEEGRPIKALWDIPGASPVTYTSLDGTTVLAGNPITGRLGGNAELYFPHIGAIHEYFLRCIQKTLRPKGFAKEGCTSAPDNQITPPGGYPPPGEGKCVLGTGLCSPDYLSKVGGWEGCKANQASIICNRESGGNPFAENLGCTIGKSVDYSIGLFQINLLAHCDNSFEFGEEPKPWCKIKTGREKVVEECVNRFKEPTINILYAYQLSEGGKNWSPWAAYDKCRTEIERQCPNP